MKSFSKVGVGSIVLAWGLTLASLAFGAEPKTSPADGGFMKMDTNRDRRVSADEHAAGAKQMFEVMDANKDGKVTAEEMKAAHQVVTGRRPEQSDL